jgi:NitT/TauT family transport system permease protein
MPRLHTERPLSAGWLVLLIGLSLWEIAGRLFDAPASFLPTPSRILLEASRERVRLFEHGATTTAEAVAGFLLATAAGWLAALWISRSEAGPTMLAVAAPLERVPWIALAPVVSIWTGAGARPRIVLAAAVAFLPVVLPVSRGLVRLEPRIRDLQHSLGALGWNILLKVRIPWSLRFLFPGARRAAVAAVAAAAVAEFVHGDRGLGYVALAAGTKLQAPLALAAFGGLVLIALALDGAVVLAGRAAAPWTLTGSNEE